MSTAKKLWNIVTSVLLAIFLVLALLGIVMTVTSKKDSEGVAQLFGYQMRVVVSDSMEKCEFTDVSDYKIKDIPIRSLIFVKVMPEDPAKANDWYRGLEVGDVLTFRYVYSTQVTITHRITSIREKEEGGFIIELAGDNTNAADAQLTQTIDTSIPNNTNYVIGKVASTSHWLGVLMSFLMTPVGIVLAIIVPCFIIILLEIFRIVKTLTQDKQSKVEVQAEQKAQELEELRRRLAQIEGQLQNQEGAPKPEESDPQAIIKEKNNE